MNVEFTNPMLFGAPVFVLLVAIEYLHWRKHKEKKLYEVQDFKASSFIAFGMIFLGPLAKVTLLTWLMTIVFDAFNPLQNGVRENILGYEPFGFAWYVWAACIILDDLTYYWFHRLSHTIRILWASHIVHHSSEYYNFGTGFRVGWFVLVYKPFFYAWLAAIGFPPEMVMVCLSLETIYQFQLHTSLVPRFKYLDKIFIVHSHHQIHHACNIEFLDKNHGGIFCFWDKIFGTYVEPDESQELKYGVLSPPKSNNPFVILTHEFVSIIRDVKKARNIKEFFMYIFGPPGWSPDRSTLTTKQLQSNIPNIKAAPVQRYGKNQH